jgi:hypothetical protein
VPYQARCGLGRRYRSAITRGVIISMLKGFSANDYQCVDYQFLGDFPDSGEKGITGTVVRARPPQPRLDVKSDSMGEQEGTGPSGERRPPAFRLGAIRIEDSHGQDPIRGEMSCTNNNSMILEISE